MTGLADNALAINAEATIDSRPVNKLYFYFRKASRPSLILGICLTLLFANTSLANQPPHTVDNELRQHLLNAIEGAESFDDRFDAEVWLMAMSSRLERYIKNPEQRLDLLRAVHREAKRADLQPEIVLSVIQVESAFNKYAVSYVGAQGLMQVMPFWKKEIGRPDDNLIDRDTNLRYGCTILKHYLDREKGNLATALARYNGSYGSYKYTRKVMDAWHGRWK